MRDELELGAKGAIVSRIARRVTAMKLKLAAACCALALSVGVAKADSVFDVQGTIEAPDTGSISGTLTINVTAGSVTAINVTVDGLGDQFAFTDVQSSFPFGPQWRVTSMISEFSGGLELFLTLTLNIETPRAGQGNPSLVGFRGGSIDGTIDAELVNPSCLSERWSSRLVAKASEKSPEHQAQAVHVVCLAPLSGHVPR
jgi:hypothetical protein